MRLTASRVTVFDGHEMLCVHPRLTGRKGQYSTLPEHVPSQHLNIDRLWSRRWFTDRARSVGPATVTVIEQILDGQVIEAQGYLAYQNTLDGLGENNRERTLRRSPSTGASAEPHSTTSSTASQHTNRSRYGPPKN